MNNKFYISEEYLTSIIVTKVSKIHFVDVNMVPEEFQKYQDKECSFISSEDTPEFNELREKLGELGYIEIQRSWWNGDRVLNPFYLNDVKFNKNETFPCGVALGIKFKVML